MQFNHKNLLLAAACVGCGAAFFVIPAAGEAAQIPAAASAGSESSKLAFRPAGKEEYQFNTGILRGTLRPGGRSAGLSAVVHVPSGVTLAGSYGILSHYRVFATDARYGHAAWDWPSVSKLLTDGAVEVRWPPAKDHPFQLTAIYRFSGPATLDLETIVKPQQDLPRFEVFLASYFAKGFAASFVYVGDNPEAGGKPGFLPAKRSFGYWQMFPRDQEAVQVIADGRWRHPPNPVKWTIMPSMAAPIGMRRDEKTGLTAVVMARPEDCFAVATPYGAEGHRSLYLSLFGREVKAGETARARSRLVIAPKLSDQQAIELYQAYLKAQKRRQFP